MTLQSPRIYIYKITFEEVPYYYYGVHKEKRFNEYYMGSPITHKWVWDFYTPKKQILQFFEFTDEGWLESNLVEDRLIRPFYQTDKWCLNESCGGMISLEICSNAGKIGGKISGKRAKELGIGVHGMSLDEKSAVGKKGGEKAKELGLGIHALTPKQRTENGKKGGKISGRKTKELGIGVHGRTKEEIIEHGRKGGKKTKELGIGIYTLTKDQRRENGKKGAIKGAKNGGKKAKELGIGVHGRSKVKMTEDGKKGGKISGSQKWKCTETGFITNAGNLTKYQRARGIDTSKRIRLS